LADSQNGDVIVLSLPTRETHLCHPPGFTEVSHTGMQYLLEEFQQLRQEPQRTH
jgi:hypothetical protein